VPPEAITVTCPVLVSARHLICSVPDRRKAEAVRNAIEGPLVEACPASLVMTHPRCAIFLDAESASLLTRT
jgi:glucosamine-6-phosphate deaminase